MFHAMAGKKTSQPQLFCLSARSNVIIKFVCLWDLDSCTSLFVKIQIKCLIFRAIGHVIRSPNSMFKHFCSITALDYFSSRVKYFWQCIRCISIVLLDFFNIAFLSSYYYSICLVSTVNLVNNSYVVLLEYKLWQEKKWLSWVTSPKQGRRTLEEPKKENFTVYM